jgi:hypothetical protein
MYEVLALAAGVALGLAVHQLPRRLAWLWGAAGAVVVGVSVAALSGELAESWAFALFDTAQVAVAAALTAYLATAWRRRRASS